MSDACAIGIFFFYILFIYLFLFFGNGGGGRRPAEVGRTVDGRCLLGCSGTDTQSGLNLGVTDVGQVQLAVIVLTIFVYGIFFVWFFKV